MKLSAYAKHLGIHYDTAYRMWQRGEIAGYQLPSGTTIVTVPEAQPASRPQKVAVYARVSSTENRANLERQAERVLSFCSARGWVVSKIVKECGSGVNEQPETPLRSCRRATRMRGILPALRQERFRSRLKIPPGYQYPEHGT